MKKPLIFSVAILAILSAIGSVLWIKARPLKLQAGGAKEVDHSRPGRERTEGLRSEARAKLQQGPAAKPPHNYGDVNQIWIKGTYENNLVGDVLIPFDAAELERMAAAPDKDSSLMVSLILRAAADGDRRFRHLLDVSRSDKTPALNLALEAYDYEVNGNREALDRILAVHVEDFKHHRSGDSDAIMVLAYVNEWDLVKDTFETYPMSGDGAGGDAKYAFWLTRRYLYPNNPRFPKDIEQFRKVMSGPKRVATPAPEQ